MLASAAPNNNHLKSYHMRKKFLFLAVFAIVGSSVFAQKDLRKIIAGERGVSKQFTTLAQSDQVPFNPKNARQIFNLDENSDLVLKSTEPDNLGFVHYRFYQTYRGVPIENTMYIVHTKTGKITGMSGTIVTDFDTQMDTRAAASVTGIAAVKTAIKHMNARKYVWEDPAMEERIKLRKGDAKATYFPTAERVWFSSEDEVSPRELRLCYKVDVYSLQPFDRKFIFIDAQTGKVTGTKEQMMPTDATGTAATGYSGIQTIHSDLNGTSYRLRDYTKGNGIITLRASNHTDYTSSSSNWSLAAPDKWALDAHFGVAATWTYYKNNFNRNSIDNAGYALTSWVNDANTVNNAYWDGSEMVYGIRSSNSNGVTAIDVTGHELTHGVTQYTSNLTYSKEPGAMNESMSDIMGKSVQFYTKPSDTAWMLSYDMSWLIRDFANPNTLGQPDTYQGTFWSTSSSDNYGVHTNSGVGNFMFYLLVKGGGGTNDIGSSYSVTGIGLSKADQIIYRTETVYLTSTSNYAAWRTACINAATDLYGSTSNEVIQVENAWYAVGIGTAGSDGGTTCNAPTGLTVSNITTSGASISWNAVSGATSYNLQYKTSSASTYTTVSTTSASYTLTGLAAGTTYNYQVATVCSGGTSAYTASTFTTSGTGTITYCTTKGSTGFEFINKVVLGSINNTSGNNSGYRDYTALSTNLTAGTSYTVTLTPGFSTRHAYTEYWTVYIDYNHDGILNGSGETVAKVSGSSSRSVSFTVPATAKNGATRIRIQMQYGGYLTNPCGTFNYGEAEDYTVNISGGSGFNGLIASNNLKTPSQNSLTISPNPVAGSHALASYTLTKSGNVSIKIADLNGRTLQTAVLGNQLAGTHTYNLNNLSQLPSGNYIIVLQQDNQIITRTHLAIAR
jgi:bacillolysin